MDADTWNGLYRLLSQLGYPRPQIGYVGQGGKGQLQIAWPDREVGIAVTDIDDPGPFKRDGWEIIPVNLRQLAAIGPVIGMLDTLSFAHRLSASRIDAKSTVSKTEQNLLRELLRLGMPDPDRNISIIEDETGRTLTVPDFAWIEGPHKLAVFVDGYYFHGGQDRKAILEIAAEDPARAAALEKSERDKLTRDADARRHMTAQGWQVVAVTDTEIDDHEERIRSAKEIRDAWDRLRGRAPQGRYVPASPNGNQQTTTSTQAMDGGSPEPPVAQQPAPPPIDTEPDDIDRSASELGDIDVPEWAR